MVSLDKILQCVGVPKHHATVIGSHLHKDGFHVVGRYGVVGISRVNHLVVTETIAVYIYFVVLKVFEIVDFSGGVFRTCHTVCEEH